MSYDGAYRICVNKIVDNFTLEFTRSMEFNLETKSPSYKIETLFGVCARVVSQPRNTLVVEE